eukprot:1493740-Prymnesium_polylepis.1
MNGHMVRCSAMLTLSINELLFREEVAIGFVHVAFACPLGRQAFAAAQSTLAVSSDVLVPEPGNVSTIGERLMMQAGAVGAALSLRSSDSPSFRRWGDTALAHDLGTRAYKRETLLQDLVQPVLTRLRA